MRTPFSRAPFQFKSSIHPISGCKIIGPSITPILQTPETVPARGGGTDSLANANPIIIAPEAYPTMTINAMKAQIGSEGTYSNKSHPALAMMVPARYRGFLLPICPFFA